VHRLGIGERKDRQMRPAVVIWGRTDVLARRAVHVPNGSDARIDA
jgi:hypothetical protein